MPQKFFVKVDVGKCVDTVKFQQDFLIVKHLVGYIEFYFIHKVAIDYPMQLLVIHAKVRV